MKGTDYLYIQYANRVEKQIRAQVFSLGDKLPSIREVSELTGYSLSTVIKAYQELESRSLIQSRPQSGYYVSHRLSQPIALPSPSQPLAGTVNVEREDLIDQVFGSMADPRLTMFSLGAPANELLPIAKLNKGVTQAMRQLSASGTAYEWPQGNLNLRREVAKWSGLWGGALTDEDIVTTSGGMSGLSHCLMSLTKPGDTIVVESPAYYGLLQLARSLGLFVWELPTNMSTGIELEALQKALSSRRVTLCVLMSNFSNPSGSMMPDEHKREVVRLMERFNTPLLEDDIYGDLYFGLNRPTCCKTYDESGLVLYVSSFSKTLAPGYRVGWVAPGQFKRQILRTKLYHTLSSTSLTHEVIGNFLKTGRYEHHLRKTRKLLHHNKLNYLTTIQDHFPSGTKVSQSAGGFFLWVELDPKIDTAELYKLAMQNGISLAPGRIFTLQDQFSNCMRLNYGLQWNDRIRHALQILGKLARYCS